MFGPLAQADGPTSGTLGVRWADTVWVLDLHGRLTLDPSHPSPAVTRVPPLHSGPTRVSPSPGSRFYPSRPGPSVSVLHDHLLPEDLGGTLCHGPGPKSSTPILSPRLTSPNHTRTRPDPSLQPTKTPSPSTRPRDGHRDTTGPWSSLLKDRLDTQTVVSVGPPRDPETPRPDENPGTPSILSFLFTPPQTPLSPYPDTVSTL